MTRPCSHLGELYSDELLAAAQGKKGINRKQLGIGRQQEMYVVNIAVSINKASLARVHACIPRIAELELSAQQIAFLAKPLPPKDHLQSI